VSHRLRQLKRAGTKRGFLRIVQRCEVGAHAFEQRESPDNIRLNELAWSMNRAIHVALGGKIDDRAWPMLLRKRTNQFSGRRNLLARKRSVDHPSIWQDSRSCLRRSACRG